MERGPLTTNQCELRSCSVDGEAFSPSFIPIGLDIDGCGTVSEPEECDRLAETQVAAVAMDSPPGACAVVATWSDARAESGGIATGTCQIDSRPWIALGPVQVRAGRAVAVRNHQIDVTVEADVACREPTAGAGFDSSPDFGTAGHLEPVSRSAV